jgi:hypothetical protein
MKWTRAFAEAIAPFSIGVYVNFLGEEGEDRNELPRSRAARYLIISPPLRGGDEGEGEKRTQSPPPNLPPQGGGI